MRDNTRLITKVQVLFSGTAPAAGMQIPGRWWHFPSPQGRATPAGAFGISTTQISTPRLAFSHARGRCAHGLSGQPPVTPTDHLATTAGQARIRRQLGGGVCVSGGGVGGQPVPMVAHTGMRSLAIASGQVGEDRGQQMPGASLSCVGHTPTQQQLLSRKDLHNSTAGGRDGGI